MQNKHTKAELRILVNEEERFLMFGFLYEGLMLYLKCRPVHMHSRAVVVAEPLQILLCVCSQDRALQFSVYCGIAEERKMKQIVTTKVPEETWVRCQFGDRTHNVAQILNSLSFLLKLKHSMAEVFGLNNPNNSLQGYYCLCCYSFPKSL